ncbi:radical SAM protein [Roseofilum reptotaenium CS-1145]|uniref:Radical SAM core domain-containing protein n=2 Tax=Roseofilum TaxID=1233426 RepID=A0A1L9QT01_9CYAN|nr:radical SAM protein [Roseofilum reptotaenium CS-1145]OJJ25788.1 hypothetical protein BI308_09715 [Roseofilum reptotaenium AO1-A]
MYYPSQYNHLFETTTANGKPVRLLSNLFFGASIQVNAKVYKVFKEAEINGSIQGKYLSADVWQYFLDKGFVWTEATSEDATIKSLFRRQFNGDAIAAHLKGGDYGFITSLNCNLACPYCFQRSKADSCGFLTRQQVDLAFNVIESRETKIKSLVKEDKGFLPKISITGGEPLLPNKANLEVLEYLLERLGDLQWPYSITTNGTELAKFVKNRSLEKNCNHIQVTLDGSAEIHDRRRCFRNGAPSFEKICSGIDAALSANWPIVLRVNLDIDSVKFISQLSQFVQKQGWCNNQHFYAYVSPVTDHGNIGDYENPNEADLLVKLLDILQESPEVREVFDIRHFRGFSYVEQMLNKKPRYPIFYRCEAVREMYIFDPKGDIHVCLEAVGDRSFRIGTYDPSLSLNDASVTKWTQRSVMDLDNCRNCKVRFICSGGCAFEGFNYPEKIHCMPFLEEIDIAWEYYVKTKPELFKGSAL